ncbi:erythromycin resistance leader peptide [Bacillus sp. Marseille-Q3570]
MTHSMRLRFLTLNR